MVRRYWLLMTACAVIALLMMSAPTTTAALRYVDGQLVLKMQPGGLANDIAGAYNLQIDQHLPLLDVYLLSMEQPGDIESMAATIEGRADVEFCHPNFRIEPLQPVQSSLPVSDLGGGSEQYAGQSAVRQLRADSAASFGSGASIRVAILDGGVNVQHPALLGKVTAGYDYVDDDTTPHDEPGGANSGHGTFVAGMTALIAPDAEIVSYRVANPEGEGDGYHVAEAILRAVNDGCDIINLSLVTYETHHAIASAVSFAMESGAIVVAAAGNGRADSAHYPANQAGVIGVAAIDSLNHLTEFSSYGNHVDICAPGESLYGPYVDTAWAWWGGTSFAAPLVSAALALGWSYQPAAASILLIDAMQSTAMNLDADNPEFAGSIGAGMIDPLALVLAMRGGANVLRVPTDYPDIQTAIDNAEHGDTVLVEPGEYVGQIDFDGKAVALVSTGGPKVTTLRPPANVYPLFSFPQWYPSAPIIDGFTITGVRGTVLSMWKYPLVLRNNIFIGNMPVDTYDPLIRLDVYIGQTEVKNNVFILDDNAWGIRFEPTWSNGSVKIHNNTFIDGAGGLLLIGSEFTGDSLPIDIRNNIFTSMRVRAITSHTVPQPEQVEYNLFWDNAQNWRYSYEADTAMQVFAKPLFIDQTGGDYRPQPVSPVVDAGDPDPLYNDSDNSPNDIGAHSLADVGLPIGALPRAVQFRSLTPTLAWTYMHDQASPQTQFQVQVGTDNDWATAELWDSGPIASADTQVVYAGATLDWLVTYPARVRVADAAGFGEWIEFAFHVIDGRIIRVPSEVPSIREAINLAYADDTILVAPGVYSEDLVIDSASVTLLSENGPAVTILQPAGTGDLITLRHPIPSRVTVDGFTLQNAATALSIGHDDTLYLSHSVVLGSSSYGLDADDAVVSLRNSQFRNNHRPAYIVGGTTLIDSCRFEENNVEWGQHEDEVLVLYSLVTMTNSVVARNGGPEAIYLQSDSVVFVNNTVVSNNGTGLYCLASDGFVYNNIFAYNGGIGIVASTVRYAFSADYNCAFGNGLGDRNNSPYFGSNEITANPIFADTAVSDYSLLPGSPCIDAGNPLPEFNDSDGTRADIGAARGASFTLPVPAGLTIIETDSLGHVTATIPTFAWQYVDDPPSVQTEYHIQVGTDNDWSAAEVWDSGPVSAVDSIVPFGGSPLADGLAYHARVRVHNGSAWGDWWNTSFTLRLDNIIHVPAEKSSIQAAIVAALAGDTIEIAPGTYYENFELYGKHLYIRSSAGPEVTVVQSAATHDGPILMNFHKSNTGIIIDGLTFRNPNGKAIELEDINATFRNCIIEDCYNVAIKLEGQSSDYRFEHVIVRNNHYGLMANLVRSVVVLDCLFEGNDRLQTAVNMPAGLLLNRVDSGVVRNCRFMHNIGYNEAAGLCLIYGGTYIVENNSFYANHSVAVDNSLRTATLRVTNGVTALIRNNVIAYSSNGVGLRVDNASTVQVDYNNVFGCVEGLYAGIAPGEGALSADPMFIDTAAGDLFLQAGSPCIDAGHPDLAYTDPDGTRNDMGALPYSQADALPAAAMLSAGPTSADHITVDDPTISWTYVDSTSGQAAYEIEVSSVRSLDQFVDSLLWSSGQVASSDTSTIYGGPPIDAGITVYLRVRVNNGITWGAWRYLSLYRNVAPPVPGGLSSGNPGNLVCQLKVNPVVDPDGDSVSYRFQFGIDSTFTMTMLDTTSSGTLVALRDTLELDTRYFWRVRATDGFSHSDWAARNFRTVRPYGRIFVDVDADSTVACGPDSRLNLLWDLPGPSTFQGLTHGFVLQSPDGALFDSTRISWVDPGLANQFDLFRKDTVYDGASADTAFILGIVLSNPPTLSGASIPVWTLTTDIPCADSGKQICLDLLLNWSTPMTTGWWTWAVNYDAVFPIFEPVCLTIHSCCDGMRGDVNDDGVDADAVDLAYLVDYFFADGPAPLCADEANCNGDQIWGADVADLSMMVDYIFGDGAPPLGCGEFVSPLALRAGSHAAEPYRVTWANTGDSTVITLHAETPVHGVQFDLFGDLLSDTAKTALADFELFQAEKDGLVTMALLDVNKPTLLPAGDHQLTVIPGTWEVSEARVSDERHQSRAASVSKQTTQLPTQYALYQNYPNPFNPSTTIRFDLPNDSRVRLEVVNILGQVVRRLVDTDLAAGRYDVPWDGSASDGHSVASGVYFYRIVADGYESSRKMLLLK